MDKPNTLPAILDSSGDKQSLQPYTTGEYLVAGSETGISVVPLADEQRALLDRSTLPRKGENIATASGFVVELAGITSHLPTPAAFAIAGVGATVLFGTTIGMPVHRLRVRSHQKREMRAALSSSSALSLPNRWIGVDVPEDLIEDNIEYPTDDGVAKVPASTLLASAGNAAPGLRQHVDSRNEQTYWQVSPGQLVTQAFALLGDEKRDAFLRTTYPSLATMHNASQQLPALGLMPRTPNSVRKNHVEAAKNLLLGTLGAYATLREMAGPIVAEKVRLHYAEYPGDNEGLLEDIVHLDQPTRYDMSWASIEDFRDSVL